MRKQGASEKPKLGEQSVANKSVSAVPSKRGYFGIGVLNPKVEENIGTLWRHARLYGADFIFTIGRRYKKQASDTSVTSRHTPLYHYEDFEDFEKHLPLDCQLVCVELENDSISLPNYSHPERAVYLLGAEDHGIPREITIDRPIIQIPSQEPQSMNVSVSGTLVMYDRFVKQRLLRASVNDLANKRSGGDDDVL